MAIATPIQHATGILARKIVERHLNWKGSSKNWYCLHIKWSYTQKNAKVHTHTHTHLLEVTPKSQLKRQFQNSTRFLQWTSEKNYLIFSRGRKNKHFKMFQSIMFFLIRPSLRGNYFTRAKLTSGEEGIPTSIQLQPWMQGKGNSQLMFPLAILST
jgi:hypothetical protein